MLRYNIIVGFILCIVMLCLNATANAKGGKKRNGKLFPVFQIITFSNTACTGTASKNGTCYTAAECSNKGGVASGSCAASYGVCCVFSVGCGQTSSQNCTYFESSGSMAGGACSVKICKCSPDVCQLRLDFNTFVISGPSTNTNSIGQTLNGNPVATGKTVTAVSQCLTDTFSVTNPNGAAPPVICGMNTGEHMYVDAADACNNLAFQLGSAGMGTSLATRAWSIKVTQYDCNYQNLAPPGCTQYFFGTNSDNVMTFNYQGGQHLADQDQNICVRRERGQCRICWTTAVDTDFQVSGSMAAATAIQTKCCQYGKAGMSSTGGDCLTVPGAMNTKNTKQGRERLCGSGKGLAVVTGTKATKTATKSKTVCSDRIPFSIRFLSDNFEFKSAGEAAKLQNGFMLTYSQTSGC